MGAAYGKLRGGPGPGWVEHLVLKAQRHGGVWGRLQACAHLHGRTRARGAPHTAGDGDSSCRVSRARWFCGRLTEWLMQSLRKDATEVAPVPSPWETGEWQSPLAHQTVAFDRAWWGAYLMLRPCCTCRNLVSQLQLPCRTGQTKS